MIKEFLIIKKKNKKKTKRFYSKLIILNPIEKAEAFSYVLSLIRCDPLVIIQVSFSTNLELYTVLS